MREKFPVVICGLLVFVSTWGWGSVQSEVEAVSGEKVLAKAEMGVEVVALGEKPADARMVDKYKADVPRTPASNLKLTTTSAALEKLGAAFRFRTMLVMRGSDLLFWGDGDPTLGDNELLKKSGWDTTTVFRNWAASLKKAGVTSVGNLIVDDSVFEEEMYHPNWPGNQYAHDYCAEVAGINLNLNCIDVTVNGHGGFSLDPNTRYVTVKNTLSVGKDQHVILTRDREDNDLILKGSSVRTETYAITIRDPAMYAGQTLADVLAANGIRIGGKVMRDRTTRDGYARASAAVKETYKVIGEHDTPIAVVLARANKDSKNLYAECLCKRLGYEVAHRSGSWENGTNAVGAFLKSAGVGASEFSLDDGCGLSKKNVISPNALVHVLMHDFYGPNREAFMKSLAIGGVDGTLSDRFKGDLRERVFGKSGFVEGVSALSGFLRAKNGQWYAFSILINGIGPKTNGAVKPLQERIVKAVEGEAR